MGDAAVSGVSPSSVWKSERALDGVWQLCHPREVQLLSRACVSPDLPNALLIYSGREVFPSAVVLGNGVV